MEQAPRKRLSRFEVSGHARLLTFSTYHKAALLDRPELAGEVLRAIDKACRVQRWDVLAFVIMPDHVHLIVFPRAELPEMPKLLFAIKRTSAYRIKRTLPVAEQQKLTTPKGAFRLWEAGAGHDRNLWSEESIRHAIEYLHQNPVRAGLCQRPEDWPWTSWHQAAGQNARPNEPTIVRAWR